MRVISLAKCKELLGINNTSYDTQLTTAIAHIDSAVKQITKNRWNYRVIADITEDSTEVYISSVADLYIHEYAYEDLEEYIMTGQLISGTGIPTDAYISEVYYNFPEGISITDNNDLTLKVDISSAATATTSGLTAYLGIPIAYQKVIADGCKWFIDRIGATPSDDTWTSKTQGKVSVSRDGSKIDPQTGMPQWFVNAFPRYMSGH